MTGKALLTLEDIRVELGGRSILRGVTTSIEQGKITALIGLNGSGKSSLLRALVGEYPCTGKIQYHCGHDHDEYEPEHIGYVPQKLLIEPRYPILVKELFALTLQKRPLFFGIASHVMVIANRLLERVGATHLLERPVSKLSGGELQRVLLALALEPHPELLLLDEPAAGIDFADQEKFYDLLARLNSESGVTILLVSHDLSIVSKHAHHVICLKDGKIACEGLPEAILSPESLSQTFGKDPQVYGHHHHIHVI
jgi:zinc transport system ATP-binding protein